MMKLTKNETFVLKFLVEDPSTTNQDISEKLDITPQGAGKIRKQLFEKKYIQTQELGLDYEKLGINIHAIAMVKILPSVFKKYLREIWRLRRDKTLLYYFIMEHT